MNTWTWILLFSAVASMVYVVLVIRDAAFKATGKAVYNKDFFQIWLQHALVYKTPKRYRTFAIAFCVSILVIVIILVNTY